MDADGNADHESLFQKLNNLYNLQLETDNIVNSLAAGKHQFVLSESLIQGLHRIALNRLLPEAGSYRKVAVSISNSPHAPPNHLDVAAQMGTMCRYVADNWHRDLVHLSAFCLWRLNWIHPFRNGNGRTARAVSYLVLCARYGKLLPAKNTVPQQIVANKPLYNKALRDADTIYAATNDLDQALQPMEALVAHHLTLQLRAAFQE